MFLMVGIGISHFVTLTKSSFFGSAYRIAYCRITCAFPITGKTYKKPFNQSQSHKQYSLESVTYHQVLHTSNQTSCETQHVTVVCKSYPRT